MIDFGKSVANPFKDEAWKEKIPIGGLLEIVPVLNFIPAGYWLEVMRRAAEGIEELPEWKNLRNLFVNGFFSYLIRFIYFFPAIFSFSLLYGFVKFSLHVGSLQGKVIALALAFVGIFLWLFATYFLPMALVNYAVKRSFWAAFDFPEILRKIGGNFYDYVVALIIFLSLMPLTFFLIVAVPLILLHPFIFFYFEVVFAHLFGNVYAESSF